MSPRSWLLLIPRAQRYLTFKFGFSRLSDAVKASTFGSLAVHRENKFIIGFDFAVTLSSPSSSCVFSKSLQDNWWNWNGWSWTNTKDDSIHHVRNFPLSVCLRVGFRCQCIWFGSWCPNWFCQTTNEKQLCGFLETCLMARLLPFVIILINASLSSKKNNKASWREECTFEEIKSTLSRSSINHSMSFFRFWSLWGVERTSRWFVHGSHRSWLLWYVFPWGTSTIRSHNSRAGKPSNLSPVSREIISDSVELCETEVGFLHIQLIGTHVWLPKTHNVPPDIDFESSRSPAKSESWNSPNLHCLAVFPTWQCCL